MTGNPATLHQSYLTVPRLNTPMVNEDLTVGPAWYRFFIGMYNRLGGSMLAQPNSVFISQAPVGAGAPLAAYSSIDGSLIGIIQLSDQTGGPAVPQVLGSSPFVFTAPGAGTLIVASGKVEISRDNGVTWYTVGLQGGPVPIVRLDQVRVSWTGSAPQVTLLPLETVP